MIENAAPEPARNTDSILRPTVVLMSGRIAAFVATFLIPVVLVRIFSPDEFGTYKQVFLLYATLYGVTQLGMAESLFYFLPRAPGSAGRYLWNAMWVLAAAGVLCAAVLVAAQRHIAAWLSNATLASYLPLLSFYMVPMLIAATLEIALISRKRYRWAACSYGFSDTLRAACFLVPALIWRDLGLLLLGGVFFALFRLGAALFYSRQEFGAELQLDRGLLRQQFAYAVPFALAVLIETAQYNYHYFAVSYYFDAATFAIYAVGCLQIPLIDFLAAPAGNVMMVLMSEKIRDGQHAAVRHCWHDTTRKLALVFFPLVAFLLAAAPELFRLLFTDTYAASVPIFRIWAVTVLLVALQTDSVLRVYAETRFLLLMNLVRLLFVVSLIPFFIRAFGLPGAVLVTVCAMAMAKGWSLVRIQRQMGVGFSGLLPWRSLAAIGGLSFAASLVPLAILRTLDLPLFPLLAIAGLAYAVAYGALLLRFRLFSQPERFAFTGWAQHVSATLVRAAAFRKGPRTLMCGIVGDPSRDSDGAATK